MEKELIITIPLDKEVEIPCCNQTLRIGDIINRIGNVMVFFGMLCPLCEDEGLVIQLPIQLVHKGKKLN